MSWFVRRHGRLIAFSALICLMLGLFFLARSTLLYASTVVVSAERGSTFEFADMPLFGAPDVDDVWLMTQAELALSDMVVSSAVDQLNLARDPRYLAPGRTYLEYLQGKEIDLPAGDPSAAEIPSSFIVRNIQQSTAVGVVQSDALLQITHYAANPELAADVANALARAFASDGLSSKLDATNLANQWIRSRVEELELSVRNADDAVQRYRNLNNLEGSEATSLVREDLAEITQALAQATSSLAKAESRYDSITLALVSGQRQAIVTEALKDTNSTELRRRYLEAQRMANELSRSQGPDHDQSRRYQDEMLSLEELMVQELSRIREGIRSRVGVERSRVEALQAEFDRALQNAGQAGTAEAGLRDLEREYAALERVYGEFLTRYQQTLLTLPVPLNEAAIVSRARVASDHVFPNPVIILTGSLLAGLLIGTGLASFIQLRDKSVTDSETLLSSHGVDLAGILPSFGGRHRWFRRRPKMGLHVRNGKFSYAIDHPFSPFAETLRRAHLLINRDRKSTSARMVGISSAVPMEGKSTFAVNLSLLLVNEGKRVLLVDSSMSRKNLTSIIAPGGILTNGGDDETGVFHDEATGLDFLSVSQFHSGTSINLDQRLKACLEYVQTQKFSYDLMVFDMPDLSSLSHNASAFDFVESLILVLAPRKTARRAVLRLLEENRFIRSRSVSAVLNFR